MEIHDLTSLTPHLRAVAASLYHPERQRKTFRTVCTAIDIALSGGMHLAEQYLDAKQFTTHERALIKTLVERAS